MSLFNNQYSIADNLSVKSYSNAYIIPHLGVFDACGEFVNCTSKRKFGTFDWVSFENLSDDIVCSTQYVDEDVLYLGFIRQHYGHFLIDSCGRMWSLTDLGQYNNYRMVFVADEVEIKEFVKYT